MRFTAREGGELLAQVQLAEAHLDEELTLEKLAAVAAFSPFHFHRVFAAITGETLSDFIRRIRLERAASAVVRLRSPRVRSPQDTYRSSLEA